LVKDELLDLYDVNIIDDTVEGILWLNVKEKQSYFNLCTCVCYLPPSNSSRQTDVCNFYDTLLTNIYISESDGPMFICGDFNSRIGDLDDFICGVDDLPEREIIDFSSNSYGDKLLEFLVESNMCVLNGRNTSKNDYTSISTKGCAVVDYCIIPHYNLDCFIDLMVTRSNELVHSLHNIVGTIPASVPDHSVLTWTFQIEMKRDNVENLSRGDRENVPLGNYDKFDVKNIPEHFLNTDIVVKEIHDAVFRLEQSLQCQNDIDSACTKLCSILKTEMYEKLSHKSIKIQNGYSNKKRKIGKPWWSNDLTCLWNSLCDAERKWLKCNLINEKKRFKSIFIASRKTFDRHVQKSKRSYWVSVQNELLSNCENNQQEFWKTIGKVGIGFSKKRNIPMEIVNEDGSVNRNIDDVLQKWKNDFSNLFVRGQARDQSCPSTSVRGDSGVFTHDTNNLNLNISILEVKKAVDKANSGKACGIDGLPIEILKNECMVSALHILFNVCFNTGVIPAEWGKVIITPIPKASTLDPRCPLSYRGIALSCAMYKLYCSILNERLYKWSEDNNIIVDEQNGFRKSRSTVDHLSSLTNLIDTRKKAKLSTFCAFIDFKKAYDFVDRDLLWNKISNPKIGVNGKMLSVLQSLYHNVSSCVRVNGLYTDWFNVQCGLRQGCSLSPLLFNMFVNDLAEKIKDTGKGICIDDKRISILLYADDIVLLAETEDELQCLLNILDSWCKANTMVVNPVKSNVVHFRPKSITRSAVNFICGENTLNTTAKYTYLGLLLDEFLDFNLTAKAVAQSAGRALGLLIAKFKAYGGMPYKVFAKLYDIIIWPIIAYGASVWGTKSYSCINSIQSRAMRFILCVGKYTPINALYGELGWQPPHVKQWRSVSQQWHIFQIMDTNRVNYHIFKFCHNKSNRNCKNWHFQVKQHGASVGLQQLLDGNMSMPSRNFCDKIASATMDMFVGTWRANIDKETGPSGRGRNKLRTYKLLKNNFNTEKYVTCSHVPRKHKSAYTKFRCGVAPLRLETGRYDGTPLDLRICPLCKLAVESEIHVMFHCQFYQNIREDVLPRAYEINTNFSNLSNEEKLVFMLSNENMMKISAKYCFMLLKARTNHLYK